MNNEPIQMVIQHIANDLLGLAHAVLETDTVSRNIKSGQNTLKSSALNGDLAITMTQTQGNNPVITALFNNYLSFIEADRLPKTGKKPPISALRQWALQRGIATDANTLWAIATAIWRDGHVGRPIFDKLDLYVDQHFRDNWSDQLFEAITHDLDKFFND